MVRNTAVLPVDPLAGQHLLHRFLSGTTTVLAWQLSHQADKGSRESSRRYSDSGDVSSLDCSWREGLTLPRDPHQASTPLQPQSLQPATGAAQLHPRTQRFSFPSSPGRDKKHLTAHPVSCSGRPRPRGRRAAETHLRILRAGWLNHVATRRCQSLWKWGFRIMPLRLGAMAAAACGHGRGWR